ncbi:DUF4852 domain-containing protein [Hahella sp. NBU794]|uniref:DUF4852 domain-containing protein n=1 Tax=Hahella sp. NBU794 TaxID=3422590 RepID=UPI003D6ECDAB
MKIVKILIATLVALYLTGCASNGRHMYVDGKCISCWNNPITEEPLNYEPSESSRHEAQTKQELLTWHALMLEGLSESNVKDLTPYGEDYLKHNLGIKFVSQRNNEISYRKDIHRATLELESALAQHSLNNAYQITVPVELGKYDFDKEAFPFRPAKDFTLRGGSNIEILPREITVTVENPSEIPSLKMSTEDAESFLNHRNNGRWVYVRYIIEITGMSTPSAFQSQVREVQFIDINPSIVTRDNKEVYPPFRSVKI